MIDAAQKPTWLQAIVEAAKEHGFSLPAFSVQGMGSARSASTAEGHFVTFKRRLVQANQADIDGVEWTLWQERGGLPQPAIAFRVPQHPQQESVDSTLALLKGWLVNQWSPDAAKDAVKKHPRCQIVDDISPFANLPVGEQG